MCCGVKESTVAFMGVTEASLAHLLCSVPQLRQLFHVFLETFFEVPCSCAAAEERRKISPMKDPSPGMRRGRKAKVRCRCWICWAAPCCAVEPVHEGSGGCAGGCDLCWHGPLSLPRGGV